MIRTRFAPSPTGSLHVGNARVAVLNWLFARRHDGTFVLRIEDTDVERSEPGAEARIREDLEWLGLDWDEGPGVEGPAEEGPYGPYRQSERTALYRELADRLLADGHAFHCYCTLEELEARRNRAIARGASPHYDGTCRRLAPADVRRLEREGRRPSVRYHVAEVGEVTVHDAVRGEIRFPAAEIGDFVLLRSDGLPTYNFAVVVDDSHMRISHVIRGAGHLSNTPRQVLLYDALGFEPPVFVHVPTVLGPDRRKLSKRHGAKPLAAYRTEGIHPDAVVNYLSLLSWSSRSGDEFLPRRRLVNEISIERVRAADVVFDPDKLRWLSAKHIEAMPLDALVEAVAPYIDRDRFPIDDERLPAAVAAVRTHLAAFSEINDHLDPFIPILDETGRAAVDELRRDDIAVSVLRAARTVLVGTTPWEEDAIAAGLHQIGRETATRGRALYEPLRTALTGRPHGPPLAALLFVIGRADVLRLLDEALREPPLRRPAPERDDRGA